MGRCLPFRLTVARLSYLFVLTASCVLAQSSAGFGGISGIVQDVTGAVGTGSGVLAMTLMSLSPASRVTA